jgi:restriction system protein
MTLWVVKGGRTGEREDRFLENSVVGVGWEELGDLSLFGTRDALKVAYRETYPGESEIRVGVQVGQMWAISHTMSDGDLVVVPLKTRGQIAVGRIAGPYRHTSEFGPDMVHVRPVKWIRKDFPRRAFDQDLLYSFGSFLGVATAFRNNAEARVEAIALSKPTPVAPVVPIPSEVAEAPEAQAEIDLEQTGRDQITEIVQRRFKGHGLGRLVDAVLRAQGLSTRVSPPGADGGVDIVAGGGSLGLETPHLVVQVKSQAGPADVTVLRELKGTMADYRTEQGLLVCWGGFKDTLRREARNDYFKIRLWDQLDLLNAIFTYYERFDEDLRAELPLKRIWTVAREEEA